MGRRKIMIQPITDDRNRNVTFGKRRNGLFKKAYELGVLCSVDVAVLVWGHNGKLFAFSSQGSLKGVVDRYHGQNKDDTDVTGPAHYGGENMIAGISQGMTEVNEGGGGKNDKGGHKKRRRSDDDSDDDDDDEGEDEMEPQAGTSASVATQSHSAPASAMLPPPMQQHDPSMYPNGSPAMHNGQRFNPMMQQQPPPPPPNLAHLAGHPYFSGYPYPGYPHHMPNVNPALGNPLSFYGPSAAAMAAAAAATGQYGYNALPPHLLRAAAQQYAQQEMGGSSNSTPTSGTMQNAGYTPIRSPNSADNGQQHPANRPEASSSYGNHQQQQQQQSHQTSPRGTRKPTLQLSFAGPGQSQGSSNGNINGMQDHQHSSSGQQQQQQQQGMNGDQMSAGQGAYGQQDMSQHAGASASAYIEQASLGVPTGMHFPDSYLTSPSQLFPEIYRSMNAYAESQAHRAMTFGAENTPGVEDEDGDSARNVFRWPALGNNTNPSSNSHNTNITTNNISGNNASHQGQNGIQTSSGGGTTSDTSNLRDGNEVGNALDADSMGHIKREADNEGD